MSRIEEILVVPGQDAAGMGLISVGVVFAGGQIAWGKCQAVGDVDLPDHPSGFLLEEGQTAIEETIIPAFRGQSLAYFRPLASQLAALTETATITQLIPQESPARQAGKLSRRDLFSGRLSSRETTRPRKSLKKRLDVVRRLHPALRYGVSQALLAAVATTQKVAIAEVIAGEYGLPRPIKPAPVLVRLDLERDFEAGFWRDLGGVGLDLSGDAVSQLGEHGERLSRLARQLNGLLARASEQGVEPVAHFAFSGTLGQLHDHNVGKVLGGLYGLERAIGPYPVWVSDPMLMPDQQAHIEKMAALKELVRMRRMDAILVARAWLDSIDDVGTLLAADAAHALHLNMRRLGGAGETIEAALIAREKGVSILLSGGDPSLLGQMALAMQPELVLADDPAGTAALRHEMDRSLAWSEARSRGDLREL